jgi:hypothetical protein
MAKVTLPTWITGIKGRLGDVVFRVSLSGETFITRSPDMSAVTWSPAQQDHRQCFKAAIAYAKAAMADPDVRAVYEKWAAEGNGRPFQVAVSDYFKGNDLLLGK